MVFLHTADAMVLLQLLQDGLVDLRVDGAEDTSALDLLVNDEANGVGSCISDRLCAVRVATLSFRRSNSNHSGSLLPALSVLLHCENVSHENKIAISFLKLKFLGEMVREHVKENSRLSIVLLDFHWNLIGTEEVQEFNSSQDNLNSVGSLVLSNMVKRNLGKIAASQVKLSI